MRTTRPQITVKPDTAKMKQNGDCPIYIYVNWRGRAKMATGIYTKLSDWREKTMTVTTSRELTRRLSVLVDEIYANVERLLASKNDFTAKDCITLVPTSNKFNYIKCLSEMAERRGLSASTANRHKIVYDNIVKVTDSNIGDLTVDDWQGVAKKWKLMGYTINTITTNLRKAQAVLSYAVSVGMLKDNALSHWKFNTDGYKFQDNPRALTNEEVNQLWDWYERTNNVAGLVWFASYYFNGMSLCDLIKYDWNSLELKQIGNYYAYVGKPTNRAKTNVKVPVLCALHTINPDTSRDGFGIKGWGDDARKIKIVKEIQKLDMKKVNTCIVNKNLKDSGITGITFYTARHTYCTSLINSNIPLNDIATLMGRSINHLSTYIKQVTSIDHLVNSMLR